MRMTVARWASQPLCEEVTAGSEEMPKPEEVEKPEPLREVFVQWRLRLVVPFSSFVRSFSLLIELLLNLVFHLPRDTKKSFQFD